MKNQLMAIIILTMGMQAVAQDVAVQKKSSSVYIDGLFGLLFVPGEDEAMGHYSLGAGYRLTAKHGLGLEWRGAAKVSCCNNFGMQGLGIHYRYLNELGVYAKIGAGKILKAQRTWDGTDLFQYAQGGNYYSLGLGYHFKMGIMLGVNYTNSQNINFDYLQYNDAGGYSYERNEVVKFPALSIIAGYVWPGSRR